MRILEKYKHTFFLQCQMDDGDILFLEFELNIEPYQSIDNSAKLVLTDKSKEFLELYTQMNYFNREVMSPLIEKLAKRLWQLK